MPLPLDSTCRPRLLAFYAGPGSAVRPWGFRVDGAQAGRGPLWDPRPGGKLQADQSGISPWHCFACSTASSGPSPGQQRCHARRLVSADCVPSPHVEKLHLGTPVNTLRQKLVSAKPCWGEQHGPAAQGSSSFCCFWSVRHTYPAGTRRCARRGGLRVWEPLPAATSPLRGSPSEAVCLRFLPAGCTPF